MSDVCEICGRVTGPEDTIMGERDKQFTSVIADSPPGDGRAWDCQCARCGSSCGFVECEVCRTAGGERYDSSWNHHDDWCDACRGRRGFHVCLSSTDWCQDHPVRGSEADPAPERGEIEWFTFDAPHADEAQP